MCEECGVAEVGLAAWTGEISTFDGDGEVGLEYVLVLHMERGNNKL